MGVNYFKLKTNCSPRPARHYSTIQHVEQLSYCLMAVIIKITGTFATQLILNNNVSLYVKQLVNTETYEFEHHRDYSVKLLVLHVVC